MLRDVLPVRKYSMNEMQNLDLKENQTRLSMITRRRRHIL